MKSKMKLVLGVILILTFLILYYYMNNIKIKNNIDEVDNQILNDNIGGGIGVHSSTIQKDYGED